MIVVSRETTGHEKFINIMMQPGINALKKETNTLEEQYHKIYCSCLGHQHFGLEGKEEKGEPHQKCSFWSFKAFLSFQTAFDIHSF